MEQEFTRDQELLLWIATTDDLVKLKETLYGLFEMSRKRTYKYPISNRSGFVFLNDVLSIIIERGLLLSDILFDILTQGDKKTPERFNHNLRPAIAKMIDIGFGLDEFIKSKDRNIMEMIIGREDYLDHFTSGEMFGTVVELNLVGALLVSILKHNRVELLSRFRKDG